MSKKDNKIIKLSLLLGFNREDISNNVCLWRCAYESMGDSERGSGILLTKFAPWAPPKVQTDMVYNNTILLVSSYITLS